jgi:hypothetical protein
MQGDELYDMLNIIGTERYIGRGDQAEGIWETLPERK